MTKKVAIIYLSYKSESYIDMAASVWKKIAYPHDKIEIIIVDNPHPKFGSSEEYIKENIMPNSGVDMPHITLFPQSENTGYAKGNNIGIRWAIENNFDYVYLHNDDGFLGSHCIVNAIDAIEKDEKIALVQSLIMSYPDSECINSAGNKLNFLGIGYSGEYKIKKEEIDLENIKDVGYASFAGVLLRVDLLKKYGLLEEDFYMYHEDLEYSQRLRSLGYRIVMEDTSVFYHCYEFRKSDDKFFYMERNRWAYLLMYYKWPTLFLIFPIFVVFDLSICLFAYLNGWGAKKLQAKLFWLKSENRHKFWQKRKMIQKNRVVGDKELLKYTIGKIKFPNQEVDNQVLRLIGNPLMGGYWWIVKNIIFW